MSVGLYIHVPFCRSRCNYCHFISLPFSKLTADRYLKAVLKEIEFAAAACADRGDVDSIYFGGGTPSVVPAEHITAILELLRARLPISRQCEISLEANPGTLSAEKIRMFRKAGVNRISLGGQSFIDGELLSIGRIHTAERIHDSVIKLREGGFENLNIDLMLGLPGQTTESWRRTIESLDKLSIPHVSVYMLDLDEECALKRLVDSGAVRLPDEDLISDLYLETIPFLSRCGYIQYEISNFAKTGFSCRHNLKYWQRQPVHGLGLGSHSFDGRSRYSNCGRIDGYFEALDQGRNPENWRELLSEDQSLAECLFLGLRLTQGLDWKQLQGIHGSPRLAGIESGMRELSHRGLVEWKDSIVRLTPSGMLLSNEVFQMFI